jgi:hypothetical protein
MDDFNYYGLGNFVHRYNFSDKKNNETSYVMYMLNRVMRMFEYDGMPDTIPYRIFELYLMVNGHCVIVEHDNKLYACFGGFSGEPDEYYMPKQYIVANPYLNLFKTFTIGEDCILVKNDSMMCGLLPMFKRYATALVENDLTMNIVDINSRIPVLVEANDDKTYASANEYMRKIIDGDLSVVSSNSFLDGLRTQPYSERTHEMLTNLIEYHQYLKASWFNDIGLNANYNMKRESITADESQLNDDMLLPLVDDMRECRKEAIEQMNNMFGTDATVDFSSTWKINEEEIALELDSMKEGADNENSNEDDIQ